MQSHMQALAEVMLAEAAKVSGSRSARRRHQKAPVKYVETLYYRPRLMQIYEEDSEDGFATPSTATSTASTFTSDFAYSRSPSSEAVSQVAMEAGPNARRFSFDRLKVARRLSNASSTDGSEGLRGRSASIKDLSQPPELKRTGSFRRLMRKISSSRLGHEENPFAEDALMGRHGLERRRISLAG